MNRLALALCALLLHPAVLRSESPPPFDLSATSVPVAFSGESLSSLLGAIRVEKGEFETTAEYEARRRASEASAIHVFALKAEPPTYDADKQLFAIRPSSDFVPIGSNVDFDRLGFVLETESLSESTYEGTNTSGATRSVQKAVGIAYALLAKRRSDVAAPSIRVRVPVADAPRLKESLRVLLIANVSARDIPAAIANVVEPRAVGANGVAYIRPTVAKPLDLTMYYFVAVAEFSQYWVYDAGDGKVLAKADGRGRPLPLK
jgi:hypothetical protein